MRLYLAAPFAQQAKMRLVRDRLQAIGVKVGAGWIDEHDQSEVDAALRDRVDVKRTDVLVRFATEGPIKSGGRFVEMGLALAWGKVVVVVGPEENIFDHLPEVIKLKDEGELYEWLQSV